MKRFPLLLLVLLGLFACTEKQSNTPSSVKEDKPAAQEATIPIDTSATASNAYREEQSRPEDGQFYFSESYHFELTKTDANAPKEFGFYLDPESGTILLEKYLTGFQDEMTDWLILRPNGLVLQGFTDEFGKKNLLVHHLHKQPFYTQTRPYAQADFKAYWTKQEETKEFGPNKYYQKSHRGVLYQRQYPKTEDKADLYLAETRLATHELYYIDRLLPELGMPYRTDFGEVLDQGVLVLKESYTPSTGQSLGFQLKEIMASEYHIQLPEEAQIK